VIAPPNHPRSRLTVRTTFNWSGQKTEDENFWVIIDFRVLRRKEVTHCVTALLYLYQFCECGRTHAVIRYGMIYDL
jgi:hypothetical protein